MSFSDKACRWITDRVQEGRGAVVFSLEESAGLIGVWIGEEESAPALGCGEDAVSAIMDAMRRGASLPNNSLKPTRPKRGNMPKKVSRAA